MTLYFLTQIKYTQDRDAGIYECQVSTSQGPISRRVQLNVIYPEAFIQGGEEYHVDDGSPISLTCVIGIIIQFFFGSWSMTHKYIMFNFSCQISILKIWTNNIMAASYYTLRQLPNSSSRAGPRYLLLQTRRPLSSPSIYSGITTPGWSTMTQREGSKWESWNNTVVNTRCVFICLFVFLYVIQTET